MLEWHRTLSTLRASSNEMSIDDIRAQLNHVISLLWVREAPLRSGFEDVAPPVGDEASPQPAGVRSE